MVYKWYILPIGGLYTTYHPLQEPEKSSDNCSLSSPRIKDFTINRNVRIRSMNLQNRFPVFWCASRVFKERFLVKSIVTFCIKNYHMFICYQQVIECLKSIEESFEEASTKLNTQTKILSRVKRSMFQPPKQKPLD